ncbi:sigma factor [Streptomyces sp. NPDC060001]|uniref:sigma factor n=1 Tax=Streptomyces sp. NPDC060001 TaxID=3347032 RepID=UPI0036AF4DFB
MSRTEVTAEQIHAAQSGDSDAMWEIVQAFDSMLKGIVRSVAPRASAEDAEDYLQEARAVLIQHVRDYDSAASTAQLTSYVYRAARRAIAEANIANSCAVAVPMAAAIQVRHLLWSHGGDVDRAWEELAGMDATHTMTRETFIAILGALAGVDSLDAPAGGVDADGSGLTLSDVIEDPTSQVTDPVERRDLARWLMTQIPQRQSLALRAFYGVTMTRMTDPELCADMEINGVALRRLRSRGVVSARTVASVHGLAA